MWYDDMHAWEVIDRLVCVCVCAASLLRVFNFFGFCVVPPNHALAPRSEDLLHMAYVIGGESSDDDDDDDDDDDTSDASE